MARIMSSLSYGSFGSAYGGVSIYQHPTKLNGGAEYGRPFYSLKEWQPVWVKEKSI